MIWVDCDGVLADFTALYLELLYEVTCYTPSGGRRHTHEDVTHFQFEECVSSPEEDECVWRLLDTRPGLVSGLRDLPGAVAGLEQLRKLGKVGCLTSPHLGPYWMYERAQWLLARGFTKRRIMFASDKAPVSGSLLIDDKYENCVEWSKANDSPAILLNRPWNARYALRPTQKVRRANSWEHVVRLAQEVL